jgi:hypothetical protein
MQLDLVAKRSVKASWAQQLLQWMLVTVKSCPTLTLNLTMTLKEKFLTGFFHYNKTFQLDIKAVQMACYLCPLREEAGIWIPNRFPLGTETYIL